MFGFNKKTYYNNCGMKALDIIPVYCKTCGKRIIPKDGMIPIKCPKCGKFAWEE